MAQAVVAEIGARSRVVRLEALGAIAGCAATRSHVGRSGLSLRLGNGAADDGARGKADGPCRGGRTVIAAIIARAVIAVARTVMTSHIAGAATIITAILHVIGLNFALLHGGREFLHGSRLRFGSGSRSGKAKGT